MSTSLAPLSNPQDAILTIRGQRVILDADLAALYGVTTKALNQAVRRNLDRFPPAFMFQLTSKEYENLRSQIMTSSSTHGGHRYLPRAFTEHDTFMVSNVLNSPRAVKMSVAIIPAFIRLRKEFAVNLTLANRLAEIEKTLISHNAALRDLYTKIRPLLMPPEPPRKRIPGFGPPDAE